MSKYIVYTKEKGKIETTNVGDFHGLTLHREDGPAYQKFYKNGQLFFEEYYINGKEHREDGPAYQEFFINGQLSCTGYYINGIRHRLEGAAYRIFYDNGVLNFEKFFIDGKNLTFDEWKAKVKPKTIEVKSKADLEKQAKKDKNVYPERLHYYISTTGNKPIVYTIKESNIFESFTEFYSINESKKSFSDLWPRPFNKRNFSNKDIDIKFEDTTGVFDRASAQIFITALERYYNDLSDQIEFYGQKDWGGNFDDIYTLADRLTYEFNKKDTDYEYNELILPLIKRINSLDPELLLKIVNYK